MSSSAVAAAAASPSPPALPPLLPANGNGEVESIVSGQAIKLKYLPQPPTLATVVTFSATHSADFPRVIRELTLVLGEANFIHAMILGYLTVLRQLNTNSLNPKPLFIILKQFQDRIRAFDAIYLDWIVLREKAKSSAAPVQQLFYTRVEALQTTPPKREISHSFTVKLEKGFGAFLESEKSHYSAQHRQIVEMLASVNDLKKNSEKLKAELETCNSTSHLIERETIIEPPAKAVVSPLREQLNRNLQGIQSVFEMYNTQFFADKTLGIVKQLIIWCIEVETFLAIQGPVERREEIVETFKQRKAILCKQLAAISGISDSKVVITGIKQQACTKLDSKKRVPVVTQMTRVSAAQHEDIAFEKRVMTEVYLQAQSLYLQLETLDEHIKHWSGKQLQLHQRLEQPAKPVEPKPISPEIPRVDKERKQIIARVPAMPIELSRAPEGENPSEAMKDFFLSNRWDNTLEPSSELKARCQGQSSDWRTEEINLQNPSQAWVAAAQPAGLKAKLYELIGQALNINQDCMKLESDRLRYQKLCALAVSVRPKRYSDLLSDRLTDIKSRFEQCSSAHSSLEASVRQTFSALDVLISSMEVKETHAVLQPMVQPLNKARQAFIRIRQFLDQLSNGNKSTISQVNTWMQKQKNEQAGRWLTAWKEELARFRADSEGSFVALGWTSLKESLQRITRVFDTEEPVDQQIEKFISWLKEPKNLLAYMQAMESRENNNLNALLLHFLQQVVVFEKAQKAFEKLLLDLRRLEWDIGQVSQLHASEAANSPQRGQDLAALKAQFIFLTKDSQALKSYHTTLLEWLTRTIDLLKAKLALRASYEYRPQVGLLTPKGVKTLMGQLETALAYFTFMKMDLENVFKEQTLPTVDRVVKAYNAVSDVQDGKWIWQRIYSDPKHLANPFTTPNEAAPAAPSFAAAAAAAAGGKGAN